MNIKKRKPSLAEVDTERRILTGMIVNSEFLENMSSIFTASLFKQDYMNQIGIFCIDFHKKYGKSPNRHIESIFDKMNISEDKTKLVEKFLYTLSDEYESSSLDSADFMYEEAINYFERFKVLNVANKAEKLLVSGNIEEAQKVIGDYKPVDAVKIDNIGVYDPRIAVFSDEVRDRNFLFRPPGDFGDFIGNVNRKELVAAVAASGIGKSWVLQYLSEIATLHGEDTLFISMEMGSNQMLSRYRSSIMRRPIDLVGNDFLMSEWDCYHNQIGTCNNFKKINKIKLYRDGKLPSFEGSPISYRTCTLCRGSNEFEPAIWYKKIYKKSITDEDFEKFIKKSKPIMARRGKIHFAEFPMDTLSIDKFRSYLNLLKSKYNFNPSSIFVDYADKMEKSNNNQYRHQIGQIWGFLKALAQELDVALITASQSNTSRNPYKNIDRGALEESILKLNLCDKMFSINQTPDEREYGKYRFRMMKQRSSDYSLIKELHVINNLALGRAYVDGVIANIPKEELSKSKKEQEKYDNK